MSIKHPQDIPRTRQRYRFTGHARIQRRKRGIAERFVWETVETGVVQHARGDGNLRYLQSFDALDDPVGVVVDVPAGEVVTVYWNTKYDHPKLGGGGR